MKDKGTFAGSITAGRIKASMVEGEVVTPIGEAVNQGPTWGGLQRGELVSKGDGLEAFIRQIVREEIDAKVKELESDLTLCKQQMAQALSTIGEQLSAELEKLMKDTEEAYAKASADIVQDMKEAARNEQPEIIGLSDEKKKWVADYVKDNPTI